MLTPSVSSSVSPPTKRTIVRSYKEGPADSARPIVPRILGWLALQLFCATPRRRRLRAPERRHLDRARQADLAFEGRRLHVYDWGGEGPAVLLVHGWGGHAGQFHALIEALVAQGRRVVAFDHPGHGRSAGHTTDIAQMARAIETVVGWTGATHTIVAHSLGAPAVALARVRHDRVAFIAAAAKPGAYWDMLSRVLRLSARTKLEGARHVFARTGVTFEDVAMARSLAAFEGEVMFAHDPSDRVTSIDAVAEVVAGRDGATLLRCPKTGHRRILSDTELVGAVLAFASP